MVPGGEDEPNGLLIVRVECLDPERLWKKGEWGVCRRGKVPGKGTALRDAQFLDGWPSG